MSYRIPGITIEPDIEEAYPGTPLKLGDSGLSVLNMKNSLSAISVNFTAIPKIFPVNSEFDELMEAAVKEFQKIFRLPVTGVIDKTTWYEIRKIYTAVRKLARTTADVVLTDEIIKEIDERQLVVVPRVQLIQYFLNVLSSYYNSIPAVDINGMLTNETIHSIMEFQKTFNLPVTGLVDDRTWSMMYSSVQGIINTLPPSAVALPKLLYPQIILKEGDSGPNVYIMQEYLEFISSVMPEMPSLVPNGVFGPETTKTVIAFENIYGLTPDGIIDEETWNKIVYIYRQLRFSVSRAIGQYPGNIFMRG